MAGRDKNPPDSCLEQQQKGDIKSYGIESHGESLSGVTMEAATSNEASGTEESQQVLDPTHDRRKQMDLELQQTEAQREKDLMLSKYRKDPNPPLL